ncbi:DUF3783 domain-containing protein [Thermococcus sp.]|uniref:DUF3783 domain-containing protein n=1 Tax=Thermococcus sp. TaxID=35749 RepID=UPI002605E0F2|nr:DUF3783 domain-containing protein [Thermococcus sp.]
MNEAVFLIGFSGEEVEAVRNALDSVEVHEVPKECLGWKLKEVVERKPEGRGDWHERKFLIIHGPNDFIKRIISAIRPLKLGRIIFVSTTPISLKRTLDDLIGEWLEEDEYFRAYRKMKAQDPKGPYLDIEKG